MFNDLRGEIDIQIGPVEVAGRWLFDIDDLAHRDILEPGKILIRHEHFPVSGQKPDAVAGDIGDFNRRSVFSKRS